MPRSDDRTATATVGSDGVATATITIPTGPGPLVWLVDLLTVETSTGRADTAKAYVYRENVGGRLLASTDRGGASSASGSVRCNSGQKIVAYWTGATPGDTATLYIEAEVYAADEYRGK